jgi:MFS family permease
MSAHSYRVVWALLVYAWVANYLIRMALGALLPPVMSELGLTYTEAGLLSTAFFYAYMAMQFPAGVLGDRFGRKRMLVAGIAIGAASSVITGLAPSFAALFCARLLTGLGQGFLFSNDRVIIAATTPPAKMALGQGISFSGPGIGTTLGLLLAGVLGTLMPWRHVFFLFALPPLAAALLVWRAIPEPPRRTLPAGPGWPFSRVVRTRDFWLLGLAGIAPVYLQFTLATWAPLFFAEVGVTDLGRSAGLASLQGIVAPAGLLASGLVADRLHRRGIARKLVVVATQALAAGSAAAMGLALTRPASPALLTALMLAASFLIWCAWGPCYAILGDLFPPSVLGKAFGLYNTLCFAGAIAGPLITGWAKDATGSFAPGLYVAALAALGSAAAAWALAPAFGWRAGPPRLPRPGGT